MKKKVYFLTGFLGAGKTTLLNYMLKLLSNENTGVIVNDFGKINVDRNLVHAKKGMKIDEINNGSIFCSCLSGTLIKTILAYKDLPVSYLLVESTGLAKPNAVNDIVNEVLSAAGDVFDYAGMICVVDALNFMTCVQTVGACKSQIIYSDIIVLNKTDQVDERQLEIVQDMIRMYNKKAPILKTQYSQVGGDILRPLRITEDRVQDASEGIVPRIIITAIRADEKVDIDNLQVFLSEAALNTLRIKGFVNTSSGSVYVNCIGKETHVDPYAANEVGLVFIYEESKTTTDELQHKWETITGSDFDIL